MSSHVLWKLGPGSLKGMYVLSTAQSHFYKQIYVKLKNCPYAKHSLKTFVHCNFFFHSVPCQLCELHGFQECCASEGSSVFQTLYFLLTRGWTSRARDEALSLLKAQSVFSRTRMKVIVERKQTERSGTELGYYLRDNELFASLGFQLLIYLQESLKWMVFKGPRSFRILGSYGCILLCWQNTF